MSCCGRRERAPFLKFEFSISTVTSWRGFSRRALIMLQVLFEQPEIMKEVISFAVISINYMPGGHFCNEILEGRLLFAFCFKFLRGDVS